MWVTADETFKQLWKNWTFYFLQNIRNYCRTVLYFLLIYLALSKITIVIILQTYVNIRHYSLTLRKNIFILIVLEWYNVCECLYGH